LFFFVNLKIGKRNFIFSAPGLFIIKTNLFSIQIVFVFLASAGKTIVSELLLIKSVLETKRKALFIEPYVSIVQEKANYFRVRFFFLFLQ
jgi:superfamily II helicase